MPIIRRRAREIPLRFDDGFRGNVTIGTAGALVIILVVLNRTGVFLVGPGSLLTAASTALAISFIAYVIWTHRAYASLTTDETMRIAAAQHHAGTSRQSRMLGLTSSESWAISASTVALAVALLGTVLGRTEDGALLAGVAVLTAIASWVTVVSSFALRYLRLHAAGERFEFAVAEGPGYDDFVTLAVTISCAGSLTGASPQTRAGLHAVRAHTVIAFAFNALIVALLVSAVVNLASTLTVR